MQASQNTFTETDVTRGSKISVLEERDASDCTPLHLVCRHGQAEAAPEAADAVVAALIAEGADVHAVTRSGYTPLYFAAASGTVEMVNALVEAEAVVNAKACGDWLPIHYCVRYARERQGSDAALDLLKCLLLRGAAVNALTAVPVAAIGKEDSKPWHEDATGKSPLFLALASGSPAMVAALVAGGAETRGLNVQGWNALHFAARLGQSWSQTQVRSPTWLPGAVVHSILMACAETWAARSAPLTTGACA